MRSTNPVLSKPDTWQVDPAQTQGQYQAQYGQPGQYAQYAQYAQPGQPGGYVQDPYQQAPVVPQAPGRMTIDDVITKSAITMGTLSGVTSVTVPNVVVDVVEILSICSPTSVILEKSSRGL